MRDLVVRYAMSQSGSRVGHNLRIGERWRISRLHADVYQGVGLEGGICLGEPVVKRILEPGSARVSRPRRTHRHRIAGSAAHGDQ
jgi:hypothetical protein